MNTSVTNNVRMARAANHAALRCHDGTFAQEYRKAKQEYMRLARLARARSAA